MQKAYLIGGFQGKVRYVTTKEPNLLDMGSSNSADMDGGTRICIRGFWCADVCDQCTYAAFTQRKALSKKQGMK
ncbi:hypothetical protein ACOSP7_007170 [Xanthoceras sorbifolium]